MWTCEHTALLERGIVSSSDSDCAPLPFKAKSIVYSIQCKENVSFLKTCLFLMI